MVGLALTCHIPGNFSLLTLPEMSPTVIPFTSKVKFGSLPASSAPLLASGILLVTEVLSDNRIFVDTILSLYNSYALILHRWSSSRLSIFFLELFPYRDLC